MIPKAFDWGGAFLEPWKKTIADVGSGKKSTQDAAKDLLKDYVKKKIWGWIVGVIAPAIPYIVLIGFLLLALVAAIGGVVTMMERGGIWALPKDISPANGIPTEFIPDVQRASIQFQVPMQYIAAEALHEAAWQPNAYNDAPGTHAMGLGQFEPGTWSGNADPYTTIAEPDTDALRIAKYQGMGVDMDGISAPIGTAAQAALDPKQLQKIAQSCQMDYAHICAPYASPFDPADALGAIAKYYHMLYLIYGSWPIATEHYYGSSSVSVNQSYAHTILMMSYAYLADTPPVKNNGVYSIFGKGSFVFQGDRVFLSTLSKPLIAEYAPSFPVIAPMSGVAQWKTARGITTLILPEPNGNARLKGEIIPWINQKANGNFQISAGDVVGLANLQKGIVVSGSFSVAQANS